MTMTRDQIAELKRLAKEAKLDITPSLERAFAKACAPAVILDLLALAERALEPQGQALPVPEDIAKLKAYCERAGSAFSFRVPAPTPAEILALIALFNQQPVAEVQLGGWEMTNSLEWHRENGLDHLAPGTKLYAQPVASQLALPAGPVPADELAAAIKHVRSQERSLGKVVIGGEPSEVGLSFRVQQLGFAIDNLEQAFAKQAFPSPAVAQPVADEPTDKDVDVFNVSYGRAACVRGSTDDTCIKAALGAVLKYRAALCLPAEEGDKA